MKPLNKKLLTFEGPKFFKNLEIFKPNYNYLKALTGIGLIATCLITPATNWAILIIFPGLLLQRPINYDKLKETKIGKKIMQIKLRINRI